MKVMKKILKWFFLIWGVLTFGLTLLAGAYFLFVLNAPKKEISLWDVRFVLNGCGLGSQHAKQLVHSYESSRSFTGDHFDAYAILVTHVDEPKLSYNQDWVRGDRATPVIINAVNLIGGWARNETNEWFPQVEDLLSKNYYINIRKITMHNRGVYIAEITFVNPATKMVYYASVKV